MEIPKKHSPSRCTLNWLSYSHINFFIWVKSPDLELLWHFRSYVFTLPLSTYRSGYEQVIIDSIRVCTYLCADLKAAGGARSARPTSRDAERRGRAMCWIFDAREEEYSGWTVHQEVRGVVAAAYLFSWAAVQWLVHCCRFKQCHRNKQESGSNWYHVTSECIQK